MRDALTVLRGVSGALMTCHCITQDELIDVDKDIAFLSSGLLFTKKNTAEAEELRYRMHVCCSKMLLAIFSKGANACLVRNSKKVFVDILSCSFALVGVIVNSLLRNTVPWGKSRLYFRSASLAESASANIAQIISLQGTVVDLNDGKDVTKMLSKKIVLSIAEPTAMLEAIYREVEQLLLSTKEERSEVENSAIESVMNSTKQLFSGHSSDSEQIEVEKSCCIRHRNILYALQLVIVSLFSEKLVEKDYLSSLFDRIVSQAEKDIFDLKDTTTIDEPPIVPIDVDELLLLVCPQIVPAIMSCEFCRQVMERHLKKARFLEELKRDTENVADLQYLNVGLPPSVDVSIAQYHQEQKQSVDVKESVVIHETAPTSSVSAVLAESLEEARREVTTPNLGATESQIAVLESYTTSISDGSAPSVDPTHPPPKNETVTTHRSKVISMPSIHEATTFSFASLPDNGKSKVIIGHTLSPAKKSPFKSSSTATFTANPPHQSPTLTVHMRWVMDMELYLQSMCRQIFHLMKPYALNPPPILDRIISSVSSLTLRSEESPHKPAPQHPLRFPLQSSLAYKVLNHIEAVRSIALAHLPDGEQRVRQTEQEFTDIINQLRNARDKVLFFFFKMCMKTLVCKYL